MEIHKIVCDVCGADMEDASKINESHPGWLYVYECARAEPPRMILATTTMPHHFCNRECLKKWLES